MASIRMGQNNRITAERWHKVKGALASGMSNKEIMERYKIGSTTLRKVKNTNSFYEYRLNTERIATVKIEPVISPTAGVYFEEFGPGARQNNKKYDVPHVYNEDQRAVNMLGKVLLVTVIVLGFIAFLAVSAMMGMLR